MKLFLISPVNCDREGNGKSFAKLPPPTEEALIEVQYFRELAHEESTKRRKAEQDLFSALQMVNIYFRNS